MRSVLIILRRRIRIMKRPFIISISDNLRYLKLILPLLFFLEFSTPVLAQPAAITNVTANLSLFCDGGALTVSYTVVPEGSFLSGNVFTAELSNATGSFSSPVTIGTSVSVNSGNISAVIPPGTGFGTQYRIRVISSDPVVASDPNVSDITINISPASPLTGNITQPTCPVPTGSVELSGLPSSGTWTLTRNPGAVTTTGTGTSTTVSNLAPETYTFTVTDASGCISPATGNVVINAVPPTAPAVGIITQPTCAITTGSVELSGLPPSGTWTLTRNPGPITTTGTGTSTTVSNLAPGTYTFTVTDASGCISPATGNVVINAVPSNPTAPVVGARTQPTCAVPTGSVALSGLPSSGTWTLTRNPGAVTSSGTGTTTTVSNLAPGTYTFTVTDASFCVSPPTGNVRINAVPSAPRAPVVGARTQPTCAVPTGSVALSGLPYTGTWTLTRNPGAVTSTGTGTTTTVSNLAPGTYTFTVTNALGCVSPETGNVVINTVPAAPTAPVVGTITQPTCAVPTGSVALSGLPSSGTWTLTRNPGAVTSTGTGTTTTVSNLAPGTYTFTVTNALGCVSPETGNVVINAVPAAPTAPVVGARTQPTCTVPTGSVALSGLPSTGTWTLTRNPGAVTSTGTGTTTTVSNLAPETYTFTVTDASGCVSPATGNVVINAVPAAPTAPVVGARTQPTCAVPTGSVALSGLPSTGTWTLTRNPGAVTSTGTGTSTTVSNLAPGTYTFTVTNASGCVSPATGNVVINAVPAAPAAPVVGARTQPTCAVPTGSVALSGLPSTGTWTLTRNPGAVTSTGTGTSTIVSNLAPGTYTFTVTNALGCVSPATGNVVINAIPAAPAAPVVGARTQPTCTMPTGSVALSGLPSSGTWTLTRNPGAVTTTGTGTSTTVSNLAPGTYTFTVTNALGCVSPETGNVVINAVPAAPTAPVVGARTQPTCTVPTGSVALSGLPSTGTWTLTRNPGAVTSTGTGTSTTVSNLAPETYTFTVTDASGCISPATGNVVINAAPPVPTAPVVGTATQPTCAVPTGSIALSGLPSSGTWTLTRNPGAVTTTGTGTSTTVSNLAPGTYTFTVTNASGCVSLSTGNVVINAVPPAPTAPVVGTRTQPTCSVPAGSVALSSLPSSGTWTLTRNPGAVTYTGTGSAITVSTLAPGTYTFTVTDALGCVSPATANVVINAIPLAPPAPVVGTRTQPSCPLPTGSVALSGLPASGAWTLTRNPGAVTSSGTGTSITVSNLAPGNYTFTVTDASGCVSPATGNVVINAVPPSPEAPVAGTRIQPTCDIATGSVTLSGLPSSGTWTLTRNPGNISATGTGVSTTVTGLATNTYNFTVTNAGGCTSQPSANVVINAQPVTPGVPPFQPFRSLAVQLIQEVLY